MRGIGRIAPAGKCVEANEAGLLGPKPPFERLFEGWLKPCRQECLRRFRGQSPARRRRAAGSGLDPNVAFVIQRHKPRAPRTRAQDFLYSRSAYRSARLPNRSAENAAEFIARRRASLFADSRADAAA